MALQHTNIQIFPSGQKNIATHKKKPEIFFAVTMEEPAFSFFLHLLPFRRGNRNGKGNFRPEQPPKPPNLNNIATNKKKPGIFFAVTMEEPAFFVFSCILCPLRRGNRNGKGNLRLTHSSNLNIRYKKSIFRQLFPPNRFKIKK